MDENTLNKMLKEQNQMYERYGWIAHYVSTHEGLVNYHTHGLSENFDHLDLQIVLRIEPSVAGGLFQEIVSQIKGGRVFEPNNRYSKVIANLDIETKLYVDNERHVLRIIIPDEKGLLPSDEGCKEGYNQQYDEVHLEEH